MKITSFLSDKFIILFISNICIFYSIIDKKFPYFLFKCRMSVKQIIEGIIVLFICRLTRYEKKEIENYTTLNGKRVQAKPISKGRYEITDKKGNIFYISHDGVKLKPEHVRNNP